MVPTAHKSTKAASVFTPEQGGTGNEGPGGCSHSQQERLVPAPVRSGGSRAFRQDPAARRLPGSHKSVSYTHLTLPTNREV